MRHTFSLCSLVLSCLLAAQCNSPALNPKAGPGTPYPCPGGAREHLCADRQSCCPNGSTCGDGLYGCPADACCYDPENFGAERHDASANGAPGPLPICVLCRTPATAPR